MKETVTISVERYNELLEFKSAYENGKVYYSFYESMFSEKFKFIDKSTVVEKLSKKVNKLNLEIKELKRPKGKTMSDLVSMSLWELIMWKLKL